MKEMVYTYIIQIDSVQLTNLFLLFCIVSKNKNQSKIYNVKRNVVNIYLFSLGINFNNAG